MWRNFLRGLLVRIEVIRRPDLIGHTMNQHPTPDELPSGSLVLVKNGQYLKWACFRCPGGCGEKLQLSVNVNQRPHWTVQLDWLRRPSVTPSIRQLNTCRCHFWIKKGVVKWCSDSGKKPT